MATATEVGFPPLLLFFESFLEISLRSENLDMEIVSVFLNVLKFVSVVGISKWFMSVLAMSGESLF